MTDANHNAPDVLRTEILAEARRHADEILQRAREEASALLARAEADAAALRQSALEAARTEAGRRSALILETVAVEAGRRRAARVEFVLNALREEVHRRLAVREGIAYRESVIALAVGALRGMEGTAFVARLAAADRKELGDGLAEDIVRRLDRGPVALSITWDPAITDGGIVLQDETGRQIWDNRFQARLERLWPELRRHMVIEEGPAGPAPAIGGAI